MIIKTRNKVKEILRNKDLNLTGSGSGSGYSGGVTSNPIDTSVFALKETLEDYYTKLVSDTTFLGKTAQAADSAKLGGFNAADYTRRNINESISGAWTFNNDLVVTGNMTAPQYLTDNGGAAVSRSGTQVQIAKSGINVGGVALFHNNVDRLSTTSTGVLVTGNLSANGDLTVTGKGNLKTLYFGYDFTTKTDGVNLGVDGTNSGLSFYDGTGNSARIFRDTDYKLYVGARSGNLNQGITIDTVGKIGINNTSPAEWLDVAGNIKSNASIYNSTLRLRSSSTVGIIENIGGGATYIYGGASGAANSEIVLGSSYTTNTRIATSLKVGANTAPSEALDVAGNILLSGGLMRSAAHVGHLIGSYNNIAANGSNSNPIYTIGSAFNPNSTTLGNMYGIGYANTSASFLSSFGTNDWGMYVAGAGVARIFLGGSTGNVAATNAIFSGNIRSNSEYHLGNSLGNVVLKSFHDVANSTVRLQLDNNYGGTYNDFAFWLRSGAGTLQRMKITSDGKVVIGSHTPVEALDVNGSIKAGGSIYNATLRMRNSTLNGVLENIAGGNTYIFGGSSIADGSLYLGSAYTTNTFIPTKLRVGSSTAPAEALDVTGNGYFQKDGANNNYNGGANLILQNSNTGAFGRKSSIIFKSTDVDGAAISGEYTNYDSTNSGGSDLVFLTKNSASEATPVEKMRLDYLGNLKILNRIGVGTSNNPSEALDILGNQYITGTLRNNLFNNTGFSGQGWRLDPSDNSKSHLVLDRLTVRGRMDVYELVINQIRASNGSFWISDAIKTTTAQMLTTTTYRFYFDDDAGNVACPFVVGDIVKAQRFTGRGVQLVKGRVYTVTSTFFNINIETYSDVPTDLDRLNGLEFVRINNLTIDDRKGALYLTSSDNGSPFMDVIYDEVARLRVGKLAGVGTQKGYGIWGSQDGVSTDFVISTGDIANGISAYAKIAGFDFNSNRIRSASQRLHISNQYNRFAVTKFQTDNPASGARVQMYANSDTDWGIYGTSNGTTPDFQLGSTNQIAGFVFTNSRLNKLQSGVNIWMGTDYENAAYQGFGVYLNDSNWIRMATVGGNSYLQAKKDNNLLFNLNTAGTSQIAGWSFNDYSFSKVDNDTHIGLSTSKTQTADGFGRLQQGFSIFRDTVATGPNGFKLARIGQLSNAGTTLENTDGEYGFQLGYMVSNSYKEFMRVSNTVAQIAGWNFNDTTLSKTIGGLKVWMGIDEWYNQTGFGVSKDAQNFIRMINDGLGNSYFQGFKDNHVYFNLSTAGDCEIAGIKFNNSALYTTKWALNKDGSFSFGGGKISGDSNGNLSVDGSLITNNITSSNWNGTEGTSFNLNDGKLLFGDVIELNSVTKELNVYDRDTEKNGVRVGDFALSDSGSLGGSIDTDISGTRLIPSFTGTYAFAGNTYISSSGSITGVNNKISTSLEIGATYNLITNLKFQLIRKALLNDVESMRPFTGQYYMQRSSSLIVTVFNGASEVYVYNEAMLPTTGYIDLNVVFTAVSSELTVIIQVDCDIIDVEVYSTTVNHQQVFREKWYNIEFKVSEKDSTSRLRLIPQSSITELSTKGFQSLWGAGKYFKIQDKAGVSNFIESKGTQSHSSPNGVYRLEISDAGIKAYKYGVATNIVI